MNLICATFGADLITFLKIQTIKQSGPVFLAYPVCSNEYGTIYMYCICANIFAPPPNNSYYDVYVFLIKMLVFDY